MRIYEKVHLVVATPGRILDLMEKQVWSKTVTYWHCSQLPNSSRWRTWASARCLCLTRPTNCSPRSESARYCVSSCYIQVIVERLTQGVACFVEDEWICWNLFKTACNLYKLDFPLNQLAFCRISRGCWTGLSPTCHQGEQSVGINWKKENPRYLFWKLINMVYCSRQILLYSATFPLTVETFMRKHLKVGFRSLIIISHLWTFLTQVNSYHN